MRKIQIATKSKCIPIIIEEDSYEGVKKIAQISAHDIELVTGICPMILNEFSKQHDAVLFYGTVGKSRLIEELEQEGKISLTKVRGRREVYGVYLVENPWKGIRRALVICGSDKRGTIYGIFHLSELLGVSPLVFWGDAKPVHMEDIELDETVEMVSKEPSIHYRGFFINDEWPCFGNWTMQHFGGFTAKMYEHVFELLLRLKGNYLWPAMWSSSFALDGPGEASAELADEYGIIMGNSHHEPCLRASEEWDIYKGEDAPYKTAWNYTTNKEGLIEYWKDGLIRSSKYENIITVGMRGERDSVMQGTNTIEDNIAILKDIITQQNDLISKYADNEDRKMPRLLAIYKEVEKYFYGTEEVPGLREWEGLDDIILMLCEDNYGNMRTLPDENMRAHRGGFGMYYHLDYHGSPISYEWINSTPLPKIWDQMTEAYEYGVREVWMVNVGDLKGNEFPLSYFMELAYDYETWGISAVNSTEKYTKKWIGTQFGKVIEKEQVEELADILTESVKLSSLRRPEALNSHIFHPVHYNESDSMIARIRCLCERADTMGQELPVESREAYYSMIHYPLQSGMNLLRMQLYAGKNEHYAKQGRPIANHYRDLVEIAIQKDRLLAKEFGNAFAQKWKGMELEHHIGFTKWNEDGCRYPLRMTVEPFDQPRLIVSRNDQMEIAEKDYATPDKIVIRDFLYSGCDTVSIEVANGGIGSLHCRVEQEECEWVQTDWKEKEIQQLEILKISCNRKKLSEIEQMHKIFLRDGDSTIEIDIYGKKKVIDLLPQMTFLEQDGVIAIHANHYADIHPSEEGEWKILKDYGKIECGLKAFPITKTFDNGKGPFVTYRLVVEQTGNYQLEIWSAPLNPLQPNGRLCFEIQVNQGEIIGQPSVSEGYCAGEPDDSEWSQGVLDQIHKCLLTVKLQKGVNSITIYAKDPGFVLEELLIYRENIKSSYLGPKESICTRYCS